NDYPGAETQLKAALATKPDDLDVRQALAETIAVHPERRDEAMELLATPVVPSAEQQAGPPGLRRRDDEDEVAIVLASMRIDKYGQLSATPNLTPQQQEQRTQLLAQADQTCQRMLAKAPNR